jgi:hypothetical protein
MQCAGDYHRAAPIETFTASNHDRHPTDLAALRGARLVTSVETEEGRRWAESRIKTLTGGDKIAARFMRQDFFEYTPQFKLVIAGNHKPGLRSVDEAIRRRFNLVPFTLTIPPEERDELLPEKLKAELPGILNWMIEGCIDWLERGLAPPEALQRPPPNTWRPKTLSRHGSRIVQNATRNIGTRPQTCSLAGMRGPKSPASTSAQSNALARTWRCAASHTSGNGHGRGFRGINLNPANTYAEVGTRHQNSWRAG